MGWKKGKKRGPQSPEQIEKAKAARAASVEKRNRTTVRVSRNDAAMLEISRQYFESLRTLVALIPASGPVSPDEAMAHVEEIDRCSERTEELRKIAEQWLDGEDVLLAKLSQ